MKKNNYKLKYKRQDFFTIEKVFVQLVEFIEENGDYPSVISFPPEEYVYLNYLMLTPDEMEHRRISTFLDIPIAINLDKQEKIFCI